MHTDSDGISRNSNMIVLDSQPLTTKLLPVPYREGVGYQADGRVILKLLLRIIIPIN